MLPEQNLPWWRADRPWGFRFSLLDGVSLGIGLTATIGVWQFAGPLALGIPFLLGHFLLFCNTFRVGGERELLWAGTFVINAAACIQTEMLGLHLATQLLITAAILTSCLRSKTYYGVACEQINPQGYRAGAMAEGSFTRRVLRRIGVPRQAIEALQGRRTDEFDA